MRAAAFIFSLLCFLLYLRNNRTRWRGGGQEAARDNGNPEAEKAYKAPYRDGITETLETMLRRAVDDENRAAAIVEHSEHINQYGAVVNDRTLKRQRQELYTAQRKRIAIENQLYRAREAARKHNDGV